ncbi:MAG: ABC transporter ATP-binding protein [Pseudomonadota bacterium]
MLTVEDLEVRYGSIVALRGVTLHVDEGEAVSVVGPNGAGKTTLLHAITGVVPAAAGTVHYEGASLIGRPIERIASRGISLVPEHRGIFTSLTVEENLAMGARGLRDRAERSREISRIHDLFPAIRERLNQPAGRLSGGEQQQLAIARALLIQPRLLLLDEPSLGLAPQMIELVYDILSRLRGDGVTLLLVEQNAHRALSATDRTYVLRSGRIELTGTTEELSGAAQFEEAYFGFDSEPEGSTEPQSGGAP